MNTADLIASLSAEAKPAKRARTPSYWAFRLMAFFALYAVGCQFFLGFRSDLGLQLTRPLFAVEALLLSMLLLSSMVAAVLVIYPDAYQKPQLLKLPYLISALLVVLMGIQLGMPTDSRMIMPERADVHAIECALCIASVALIPSALIFGLLRKGANVHPFQAGSFAVLASSAIGGLTLRLAEENDTIMHLVQWHYIPTLLFAALGAFAGKWLLKW